jgi:hypothetical protein
MRLNKTVFCQQINLHFIYLCNAKFLPLKSKFDMSKRKPPPIGKCIHCLSDNVSRNWDHVFPESWYPDTTPDNTAKWVVPSCYKCNMEYGILEQDLMNHLACCIDPTITEISGIYPKVLRSIDAAQAKSPRDARMREANRKKLLKKLLHGTEIPQEGIYPGLGERWGREKDSQIALKISATSIRRLCEKIIRGIYYIEDKKFIEPPYKIDFYALTDAGAKEINNLLEKYGEDYAREPGILVKRVVAHEDGISGFASVQIWGSLRMYASITAN